MIESVTREGAVFAELPHKFEAGTVNAAGAVGLAAAIEYIQKIGFDAMQKQGRIWENEAQTDTDSEAGIALLETGCAAGERLDELARFLLSLELQEALRQLSAEQRKILTLLFLDDLKPTEVAGRLGCTVRNVTKHRLKALDKMRQLLAH